MQEVSNPINQNLMDNSVVLDLEHDDIHEEHEKGSVALSFVGSEKNKSRVSAAGSRPSRASRASKKASVEAAPKTSWSAFCKWWNAWTEDGIGVALSLVVFVVILIFSVSGVSFDESYAKTAEWPIGAVFVGMSVTFVAHHVLKKPFDFGAYAIDRCGCTWNWRY
jgi:hypothetical protein